MSVSPSLVTPDLGTPSALVGTNITGTAAGLTAGNVTTNANLSGEVTSVGNTTSVTNSAVIGKLLTGYTKGAGEVSPTDNILQAIQKLDGNNATNANLTGPISSSGNTTSVTSQTGTGTTFVMNTSPTLITPNLGTPSALVGTNISGTGSSFTAGKATNIVGGGNGQIPYQSGASTTAMLAAGAAGKLLQANGAAAPSWVDPGLITVGTATNIASGAIGSIPYQSAAATTAMLAMSTTTGKFLKSNSGAAPTWVGLDNGDLVGVLPLENGGTGSSTQNFVDLTSGQSIDGSKIFVQNVEALSYSLTSDLRLKTNITPIDFSLLDKVRYVQFTMKSDTTNRKRYGVIAQELELIAPELVYTDSKGMKSVNYTDLLVAQIAKMAEMIKSLENRIQVLENKK